LTPEFPDFFEGEEKGLYFHVEDIDFFLKNTDRLAAWIESVMKQEQQQMGTLNFIFCSDNYLHQLNVSYLDHDTLTDIITFPYNESSISGDLFISIERVRENAEVHSLSFADELHRVMIHGILHLCGYGDKTPAEAQAIRQKEDEALLLLQKMQ